MKHLGRALIASLCLLGSHAQATLIGNLGAPPMLSANTKAQATPPVPGANMALTSTDYSDGWWNPAESGWGANVVQQENGMVIFLYVYNQQGQPLWLLGTASFVSENTGYQGQLFTYTGPYFGLNTFNPAAVAGNAVGTITFRPQSAHDATLTYTVNGVQVTKSITRFSFNTVVFSGEFITALSSTFSGTCNGGTGVVESITIAALNQTGSNLQLAFQGNAGTCTLSGAFQQRGRLGLMAAGNFTCTNGATGTATISELDVTRSGMTGRYTTLSGGCLESGRFGGVRR